MFITGMEVEEFTHSECHIKQAVDDWALREAQRLRNDVFVVEQGIFQTSDHDVFDSNSFTLVATIGLLGIPDAVVGTVRIHEQAPGVWVGSRLAVDKAYRSVKGLGKALIHMAVCSAKTQGCKVFYANVQLQNVGLFQKLGWLALGEVNVHGVEHMFMQANLDMYPLTHNPGHGFVHLFNQPARNAFTQRRV
jgi:putative N-acetyltransferase (TIGR04045 family)